MTGEHSQSWYVKASLGVEWGPMSFDTLREMADDGSLACDDLVRCGLDAQWQPVMGMMDQMRVSELATDSEDVTSHEAPADEELLSVPIEEPSPAECAMEFSEPAKPAKRRLGALPNWSDYWKPETSASQPPIAIPRLVPETDNRFNHAAAIDDETFPHAADPPFTSLAGIDDANRDRSEMSSQFAELEAWKRERAERLDRLTRIVAERESAAARAADAARIAAQIESAVAEPKSERSDISEVDSDTLPMPSHADQTSAVRVTSRPSATKLETWEQTLNRWKRSLPDVKAALALLLVPLAAWWLWPSSDTKTAETYRLMYYELLELRERPNDRTGMDEFLVRSHAQLDKLIPVLEKRASPNQPDVQWLLWMGRDCLRPMLKQPRRPDTKPELTFNKLMREWQRLHNPAFETADTSSVGSDEPSSTSRTAGQKLVPAEKAAR